MANPVLGKLLCSEWFFLWQDLQYGRSVVEKNKNVIDQPRSVRIGKTKPSVGALIWKSIPLSQHHI